MIKHTEQIDGLKEAIERLYYWQYGGSTSFTAKLYELFSKADPVNKSKLAIVFPAEAMAYQLWYSSHDPEYFFKQNGLGL